MATDKLLKSCNNFDACKSTLDSLRSEINLLKPRFSSTSKNFRGPNSKLQRAQAENDTLTIKISEEEEEIASLQAQVAKQRETIEHLRKEKSQPNALKSLSSKIKSLETKIAVHNEIYNQHRAINASLRCAIDDIRREKVIADSSFNILSSNFQDQRQELKAVEEKNEQLSQTKWKLQEEIQNAKVTVKNQKRTFANDTKTLENILSKEINDDVLVNIPMKYKEEAPIKLEDTEECLEVKLIEEAKAKIEYYDKAIKDLKTQTGIDNLDQIVQKFLSKENSLFSLFNQVSELSKDLELVEKQNGKTKKKIKVLANASDDNDSPTTKRLEKLKEHESAIHEEFSLVNDTVKLLSDGIHNILNDLQVNFGDEINAKNIHEAFALVENKVNECLDNRKNDICANHEPLSKIELEVPLIPEEITDEEYNIPYSKDEIMFKSIKRLHEENEKHLKKINK